MGLSCGIARRRSRKRSAEENPSNSPNPQEGSTAGDGGGGASDMAAALRNLASRLGGRAALQAANVPGRLPSRLARTRAVTEEEGKDAAARYVKILAMKEELFDEIAHFRQTYYLSTLHAWNNEMVLYPLSLGIKSRPGDTFRTSCKRIEIFNRFFWLVGFYVSIRMAFKGVGWCIIQAVNPEGKDQLEKKETKMLSAAAV